MKSKEMEEQIEIKVSPRRGGTGLGGRPLGGARSQHTPHTALSSGSEGSSLHPTPYPVPLLTAKPAPPRGTRWTVT